MSVPDDLHRDVGRALRAEAGAADDLDVDAVWSRVETGIGRRHRRRQALAVTGAALAVVAAALGAQLLAPGGQPTTPPAGPLPASTTAPTSTRSDPVPLTGVPFAHTPAQARRAFADAGYDDADAAQLGRVWRWLDADQVVVVAGLQLLEGRPLPLRPGQDAAAAPPDQPALYRTKVAYARAGYDDADAAALADRWGETSTALVEVYVGQLLLDGDLPTG